MTEARERERYSFIYNDLVSDELDLVGLIAYAIYKREKIAVVRCFKEEHGREPEPKELKNFHCQAAANLEQYKRLAEYALSELCETLIGQEIEEQEERFRKKKKRLKEAADKRIVQELAKFNPPAWKPVLQGVVASLLTSGIAVLIFMAYSLANKDLPTIWDFITSK